MSFADFVGRTRELASLERHYGSDRFEFLVVYGRRRVGKSTLLLKFLEGKRAIYFMAAEIDRRENLKGFSRAIHSALGLDSDAVFADYESAFEYLMKQAKDERLVLVIDEYPYAARTDASLPSILQRVIDCYQERSKLMIILCGSSVSYMQDEVLAYKSPLYGRRTGQLKIDPFDFFDARQLLTHFSDFDAALLYGALGGTPLYLRRCSNAPSPEAHFRQEWLDPDGFFFEEPLTLLRQEVRSPEIYFAVLKAMADGASRLNEITTRLGRDSGPTLKVLETLKLLEIIDKELPYTESTARKSIYIIKENMYRFWFSFISGRETLIARGGADILWTHIKAYLSVYMGKVFEDICRQYLLRQLVSGALPLVFDSAGRWWGNDPAARSEAEIDIVAEQDKDTALFAECKWTSALTGKDVLLKLDDLSRRLFRCRTRHLFVFSRYGFEHDAIELASEMPHVRLVTFAEMCAAVPVPDLPAQNSRE